MADEYSNMSTDVDERKRQRRKRIEKNKTSEQAQIEDQQEKLIDILKTGQQQVEESLFELDTRKRVGIKSVTDIRIETNEGEAKRRVTDEELKRSRLIKLQQEALVSAKANAAVEMKWTELLEKEIPQELFQEIQQQMESCSAIICSKDELINDFQLQLRAKDEEYVRALRQHADDIDSLLNRIRSEFRDLQTAYDSELDRIEDAYLKERDAIIGEHTAEIDAMFETRRLKENQYRESKMKTDEDNRKDLEYEMKRGADLYNKTKIDTEMNIQALKQQLEEIRATYQLNTVKLDYNYSVLLQLEVEKTAEVGRYKRRLNRLKSQLNSLVTKFTESEVNDLKVNHDLTEDYRTLTLKYKELQAKFRHFEVADTTKYDEVWTMHEEEVKDLVDKLLKADKIISEQQLGWSWKSPDMQAIQQVLGRQGGLGMKSSAVAGAVEEEEEERATEAKAPDITSNTVISNLGEDDKRTDENPEGANPEEQRKKVAGFRVRAVLKVLANEAGFMINPAIRESLESMPEDEADLNAAETLLKALGVKSEEKLHTLVHYFFKGHPSHNSHLEDIGGEEEADEYEAELGLLLKANGEVTDEMSALRDMIKPEDVISAVKAYIEDMSVEQGPVVGSAAVGGTKVTQEEIRIAQKRLAAMRNYWNQLSQIVSDDTVDVWRQLEFDAQNLRDLLSKRAASVNEVDRLAQQNIELKKLLNQYLGDAVTNASFQVPPAQVMKVRDATQLRGFSTAQSAKWQKQNTPK
jgi:dynein regulatory complex protein 1